MRLLQILLRATHMAFFTTRACQMCLSDHGQFGVDLSSRHGAAEFLPVFRGGTQLLIPCYPYSGACFWRDARAQHSPSRPLMFSRQNGRVVGYGCKEVDEIIDLIGCCSCLCKGALLVLRSDRIPNIAPGPLTGFAQTSPTHLTILIERTIRH